jgi:hypothetical protein
VVFPTLVYTTWDFLGFTTKKFGGNSHNFPLFKNIFFMNLKLFYFLKIQNKSTKFWFFSLKFRFWALRGTMFAFWSHKSIFFHAPCKIPDRWIYHTTHNHTDFWSQIPFLGSGGPKSVYFLNLYKISDRLIGHMTYFIFQASQCPADSKFFCVKNTQHQYTKYSAFVDFLNLA